MTEFEANKRRVGENIKKIRIEKGLTQLDVANSVGVTKQTICKIEKTGSTNPHTLVYSKLSCEQLRNMV